MPNLSPHHSEYYQHIQEADSKLADTLAEIRADSANGLLTPREAADNRIAVLEAHLEECRALRARYLPEPCTAGGAGGGGALPW